MDLLCSMCDEGIGSAICSRCLEATTDQLILGAPTMFNNSSFRMFVDDPDVATCLLFDAPIQGVGISFESESVAVAGDELKTMETCEDFPVQRRDDTDNARTLHEQGATRRGAFVGSMEIPVHALGLVIGKGGASIRYMRETRGIVRCTLSENTARMNGPALLTVEADSEQALASALRFAKDKVKSADKMLERDSRQLHSNVPKKGRLNSKLWTTQEVHKLPKKQGRPTKQEVCGAAAELRRQNRRLEAAEKAKARKVEGRRWKEEGRAQDERGNF